MEPKKNLQIYVILICLNIYDVKRNIIIFINIYIYYNNKKLLEKLFYMTKVD